MIILLWIVLFTIFTGSYLLYIAYLKLHADMPWDLMIDPKFNPHISVLIPVRNEEKFIYSKLENLFNVVYPHEKMEVIVIDDASTDNTIDVVYNFAENHQNDFSLKVLKQYPWKGKASALNEAMKNASHDILIVTDADTLLPENILSIALPYFADPTVGAISGRGVILNANQSWVTKGEKKYLEIMSTLRLGESKIHSTIRFEGTFCAFKKKAFDKFDDESGSDDSGTALKVVQNNFRAIFIPEVHGFSNIPFTLRKRIRIKIRRATQMTELWIKCLKLLLKGELKLPKRIAIPEIFLSIFNSIVFMALSFTTIFLITYKPVVLIPFILVFCIISLFQKTRNVFIQGVLDQFILFYSLILYILNVKFTSWS